MIKFTFKLAIMVIVLICASTLYQWMNKQDLMGLIFSPKFKLADQKVSWKFNGLTVEYTYKAKVINEGNFNGTQTVTCQFRDADGNTLNEYKQVTLKRGESKTIEFKFQGSITDEAVSLIKDSSKDVLNRFNVGFQGNKSGGNDLLNDIYTKLSNLQKGIK